MTGAPGRPVGIDSPGSAPFDVVARAGRPQPLVVGVVALGGAVGAGVRYGVIQVWSGSGPGSPWATLMVNTIGCIAIGVVMAALSRRATRRLLQPFLGTGVLGGFTTFSGYAVDLTGLLSTGRPTAALGYLIATPVCAMVATFAAFRCTTRLLPGRPT